MLSTIYVGGVLVVAVLFYFGVETERGQPRRPGWLTAGVVLTALVGYVAWLLAFPARHAVQTPCSILASSCQPGEASHTMGVGGMIHGATVLAIGWVDLLLLWGVLGSAVAVGYKFGGRRGS